MTPTEPHIKICKNPKCNNPFIANHMETKYCSLKCKNKGGYLARRARDLANELPKHEVGTPINPAELRRGDPALVEAMQAAKAEGLEGPELVERAHKLLEEAKGAASPSIEAEEPSAAVKAIREGIGYAPGRGGTGGAE